MKSILKISVTFILIIFVSCNSPIENSKIKIVKIFGNCEMCKKTIDKAGNQEKISQVDWNKNTKMATITYDSTKTNYDKVLKKIAMNGYDSEKFTAPNNVYSKLPGCCQYKRRIQTLPRLNSIPR